MKECFCFLFGLIIGCLVMFYGYRFIMWRMNGRITLLRALHRAHPDEYHLACELDSAEAHLLQNKADLQSFFTGASSPYHENKDDNAP